jgi:hypothetical protein
MGAVAALTGEKIPVGVALEFDATHTNRVLQFKEHAVVKEFIKHSMHAAISDIEIFCSGTSYSALIPDSWGTPGDAATRANGINRCNGIVATNIYKPYVSVSFLPWLTPQIKPAVLVGEPPSLLVHAPADTHVLVTFNVWRHGVNPSKPY